MKKKYINPVIKGHKIIVPQLLCGSDGMQGTNNETTGDTGNETGSKHMGGFFEDDEPTQSATKEHDFAYGL